jgi:hypothetical protein
VSLGDLSDSCGSDFVPNLCGDDGPVAVLMPRLERPMPSDIIRPRLTARRRMLELPDRLPVPSGGACISQTALRLLSCHQVYATATADAMPFQSKARSIKRPFDQKACDKSLIDDLIHRNSALQSRL